MKKTHDFPFLAQYVKAKLKKYNACYTIYFHGFMCSENHYYTLSDAVECAKAIDPETVIYCELHGERALIKRFTLTLEQAQKILDKGARPV